MKTPCSLAACSQIRKHTISTTYPNKNNNEGIGLSRIQLDKLRKCGSQVVPSQEQAPTSVFTLYRNYFDNIALYFKRQRQGRKKQMRR